MIKKYIWFLALAIVLVALSFIGGCQYHKKTFVPLMASHDTIVVYDTITHHIIDKIPYYIVKRDSVVIRDTIPAIVDTVAILADYYNFHYYTRTWEDSLLYAQAEDVITENKFLDNVFTYKIKRSQMIINNIVDNTITYNKYVYFGLDVPIKNVDYINLEALYAMPKMYLGVGYSPQLKSVSLKAGVKLLQFKK
jgi:hypothetical protein